ncbi:MAG: hypothetical protein C0600_09740, partial [Ignavibacteria bacterium]
HEILQAVRSNEQQAASAVAGGVTGNISSLREEYLKIGHGMQVSVMKRRVEGMTKHTPAGRHPALRSRWAITTMHDSPHLTQDNPKDIFHATPID